MADLNQDDFARRLGVTKQTISNWETDRTKPDMSQFLAMIDMGANIDFLLYGKGSPLQRMSA